MNRQSKALDQALQMSQTKDLLSAAQLHSAEQALVSTTSAQTSGIMELAKQFGNLTGGTLQAMQNQDLLAANVLCNISAQTNAAHLRSQQIQSNSVMHANDTLMQYAQRQSERSHQAHVASLNTIGSVANVGFSTMTSMSNAAIGNAGHVVTNVDNSFKDYSDRSNHLLIQQADNLNHLDANTNMRLF